MMRNSFAVLLSGSALVLAACGGDDAGTDTSETVAETPAAETATETADSAPAVSLAEIVGHSRRGDNAARDRFRSPEETLEFFKLRPDMTVVEVYPGGGWYTQIIAPYLAAGGGTYYAAMPGDPGNDRAMQFKDRFGNDADFGTINLTYLGGEIAPAGSADMVLTFRNVHNFIFAGQEEAYFASFFEALKPGGILGVVEHRLPETANPALEERSGYVRESRVIAMAEAAGFVLEAESDINANPADTADHPFGVWTLPPSSRTTDRDGNAPEGFDPATYLEIGESDRMTLRFRKPGAAQGS